MTFARRTLSVLTLLTTVAVSYGRADAQSVMIQPKHKAGETTYLEQCMEANQVIEGGQMPGKMEFAVKRIYGLTRKIDSASADGAKITMTFDRAMQTIDSTMVEAAFDSDCPGGDDEAPMLAGPFKALLGGTFKMELDKDGQVKQFSGMKPILEKVEEVAAGNMMAQQLQSELTDDRGRETYGEMMYLMYPNKEVKVGEAWKKTFRGTIPRVGKIVSRYDFKLDRLSEEAGRKVAVVTYTSTTEKDTTGKPIDDGMHGMEAEVKGASNGTMTYDIERGTIVKNVSNNQMAIEMNPPKSEKKKGDADDDDDDDAPAKGMKIDVKLKQVTSILSEADRAKQKEEAAKKVKTLAEKEGANKAAKKAAQKNVKKPAKDAKDDEEEDE